MSKILITGATGNLGKATIERLLQMLSPNYIVGFGRQENRNKDLADKIEMKYGDFDDVASVDRAMEGIEKVLLISTVDHHRYQQHRNVIDAAKRAGANHISYTSVAIKDVQASLVNSHLESHIQTEDYIKGSGLSYNIFRNSLYTDVIPIYVGQHVFEQGIYLPAGSGRVAFALRSEMGEGIANALMQKGNENRICHLTGRELYSFSDIARVLSEISGKTIPFVDADPNTFPDKLKNLGVPERMIAIISGFTGDIRNKQYEIQSNDLEQLLGRRPSTLEQALKLIYH
ncbi:SDR family oxidoreductase [Chryseosolibacter indicus]|uniref:SDR family oxidoreductase n=1 Tax=Chryseosolibacter indicus TaxID=2782351 RepID=A0ABS5VV04_9BACT|nr:SDR family oxidoreductase [Chryseosolibacter indicus]MBT1705270.1 SDR family oxidoreductase [Chryseosolibacter indicus]